MPEKHLDRKNRSCEPTLTPTIQPLKSFGDLTLSGRPFQSFARPEGAQRPRCQKSKLTSTD